MSDIRRAQLTRSLVEAGVPEHLHAGLLAYVLDGVPTGGFLRACLENNFVDAMCRAIDLDEVALLAVAKWIFNDAPPRCWGSPGVVKTWRGE
jgi:hypothetical protein